MYWLTFRRVLRGNPSYTNAQTAATYSSEVAHGLEVDQIGFPGIEGSVPVAIVGVVVPHGEGRGLREAAGR